MWPFLRKKNQDVLLIRWPISLFVYQWHHFADVILHATRQQWNCVIFFLFLVITSSSTVHLNNTNHFRTFTSLNWPYDYPNHAYQRFTIYSPVNTVVKLEVLDLELENSCSYDTITIYDGKHFFIFSHIFIFNKNSISCSSKSLFFLLKTLRNKDWSLHLNTSLIFLLPFPWIFFHSYRRSRICSWTAGALQLKPETGRTHLW